MCTFADACIKILNVLLEPASHLTSKGIGPHIAVAIVLWTIHNEGCKDSYTGHIHIRLYPEHIQSPLISSWTS